LGAASGTGGDTYFYGVSSEDGDGDESGQSLGVSPASIVSAGGAALGCFIGSVAQAIPQRACGL